MRVFIIYDSLYGNTERIAQAMAGSLQVWHTLRTVQVASVNAAVSLDADLLLVGSPTHGGRPSKSIVTFLAQLRPDALRGIDVAGFDTRLSFPLWRIFGYAAPRITKALVGKGGREAAPARGFIVRGTKGPLAQGEVERAIDWAKTAVENGRRNSEPPAP
jgi:flavodoxin